MAELDFAALGAKPLDKSATAPPELDFAALGAKPLDSAPPTLSQMGAAAAETGGRAAIQGGGMVAGAVAGGQLGAMAGSVFPGPGTLIGGTVGALAGGLLGGEAGEMAADRGLGLRSAQQLSPGLRPAGVFGESVGGSVPFAALPYAAAASGWRAAESGVGRLLNSFVDMVRNRPVLAGLAEASSAVSAGSAAALAETVRPGDEWARMGAEITAGALNPTRIAIAGTTKAVGLVKSTAMRFSPAAQQTEAAKTLMQVVQQTGEDPTMLARALRAAGADADLPGLTAAQRTGSPALAALEQHYGRMNKQFGAEAANSAKDGLDSIRMLIGQLQKTGDPAALSAAGELRATYIRTMLSQSVDVAKAEALRKASKVSRGLTTADRDRLGMAARESIDVSLKAARDVEDDLWSKVGKDRPARVSNIQQVYDDLLTNEFEGSLRKPPEGVRKFLAAANKPKPGVFDYDVSTMSVKPISDDPAGSSVGQLLQVRRDMLALVRATATSPDHAGMEGVYSAFADAAMKDIDDVLGKSSDTTYNEARTFTRELHDVFSRSLVGRATGVGRYGDLVAPEALLTKALAGGKQAGDLQLRDLAAATDFLPQRGFSDPGAHETMMGAQQDIIRIAADDAVDSDGFAKPERITKFLKDNAKLLDRFPEVRADLLAATKSQDRLSTLTNRAKNVEDLVAKQGAFGVAMGAGGRSAPNQAAAARAATDRVVISPVPEAELDRLIRIAQGGAAGRAGRIDAALAASPNARIQTLDSDKAMQGLARSLVESGLERAVGADGTLDLAKFRTIMTRPAERDGKPLMAMMQEKGLMDTATANRMKQLFQATENIGVAVSPPTAVDVKEGVTSQAMTAAARIAGSNAMGVAQKLTGTGGTNSIIAHSAAARFMDQAVNKSKLKSAQKIFTEAAFDPSGEKMALLLTKIDNTPESAMAARRINAWLVQSGLLSDPETEDRRSQR